MSAPKLSKADRKLVDELVQHYSDNQSLFVTLLGQLTSLIDTSDELKKFTHSVKMRVKDPEHLRGKLIRKGLDSVDRGVRFPYSQNNLFKKVNDLVGFRILHLHTRQIEEINRELLRIFDEQNWQIVKGPTARTWDNESQSYFEKLGIKTEKSETMYTSVHYILRNNSKTALTCEIQVRTLMEEVWGEVDHQINYPEKSKIPTCSEQIKVLARVTSSCSRLVDSIFLASKVKPLKKSPVRATRSPGRKVGGRK